MRSALEGPRSAFSSAIIAAMNLSENITLLHGECIELLSQIPDGSIDAIITDPPYGYLKNQKLDIPFNEKVFFSEAKRVLKPAGFIVLFGRGSAFYRWNTMLVDLGFVFKEEVIWNKGQPTSPVLPLSRVHETVSIHCKGTGKINTAHIPYLAIRKHDIGAIQRDIQRLQAALKNQECLEDIYKYLEAKKVDCRGEKKGNHFITWKPGLKKISRSVGVMKSMAEGFKEQSIMRQGRETHTRHPTQKPVRLMERLMALVTQENAIVLDPFMGSASTGVACINTSRKFIGMEQDDQYFDIAKQRLATTLQEKERQKE